MDKGNPQQVPAWLGPLSWLPVLAYFLVKYVLFSGEMTGRQQWMLLAAVILAEIALWQYRKQFRAPRNSDGNGTN